MRRLARLKPLLTYDRIGAVLIVTVLDLVLQNRAVHDALDDGITSLVTALRPKKASSLAERRDAARSLVDNLDGIAGDVKSYEQYFGTLVGLCFAVADASAREVTVHELYVESREFSFPVPPEDAELRYSSRVASERKFWGVVTQEGRVFFSSDGIEFAGVRGDGAASCVYVEADLMEGVDLPIRPKDGNATRAQLKQDLLGYLDKPGV